MDKAVNGDGWAFMPATAGTHAIWMGKESIINAINPSQQSLDPKTMVALGLINIFSGSIIFILYAFIDMPSFVFYFSVFQLVLGSASFYAGKYLSGVGGGVGKWLGFDWRLTASAKGLAYQKANAPVWSISWGDITRIESGATVEWEKVRDYLPLMMEQIPPIARGLNVLLSQGGERSRRPIPDAEMQVFIFTSDGRRLVVHTANAAREDCGRLAHSIRSYVEAQRSNAAPSPSSPSATSSPAADGFDL